MTAFALLQRLRARGYDVRAEGGRLQVSGPPPRQEDDTIRLLRTHRNELLELLDLEQRAAEHPAVRDAIEILGARLVAVRRTGGAS